ncbi:hypothetical protein V1477_012024 [Vespula maculifrons]|uniref:Uncharacterized protein n=2 Tax=Vespula TaxID=7451 RepID=A0A834MW24_VESVU|nr:hypothetical protein HZH66_011037 [Vespula vulgaris]
MQETSSGHPSRKRRHANDKDNTKGVGTRNLLWRVVHHEPPEAPPIPTGTPIIIDRGCRPIVPTTSPNMGDMEIYSRQDEYHVISERKVRRKIGYGVLHSRAGTRTVVYNESAKL